MKTNLSVGPINHRPRLSFWALTLLSAIWVTRATVAVSALLQVNWPWILQLLMVVSMSFIYGKWVFAHIHYDGQFYWRVQDDHFCFIDPTLSKHKKNRLFLGFLFKHKALPESRIAFNEIRSIRIYHKKKLGFYGLMAYPSYMTRTLQDERRWTIPFWISTAFKAEATFAMQTLAASGVTVEDPQGLLSCVLGMVKNVF